jgi:ribose-phosphate pyrophosphokinase
MRNISLFAGSSHPELASAICHRLGIPVSPCILSKFSNKETNVSIGQSVRDADVYILQSCCGSVNDNFIEMLIMVAACRTASARKITVVIPSFFYSRDQVLTEPTKRDDLLSPSLVEKPERLSVTATSRIYSISTSQPNVSVTPLAPTPAVLPTPTNGNYRNWVAKSGTLVANMIMTAGADHVITMDLHDPQYQGFFDIPMDNLQSQPVIIKYIVDKIPDYAEAVVVSPDAGGAKR